MVLTKPISLDDVGLSDEGFMLDPNQWTPEIGEAIAEREGVSLTDRHWVVIDFARKEFADTGEPPTMRRITKATDVDTRELYSLFPGGPAKLACKIAGLGKPTGCI